MKRMLVALLGLVGLLYSRIGEVRAQGAPGSRAQVYSVPTTEKTHRFKVPQVKLPGTTVARRINQELLRQFRAVATGDLDSTTSPRQQLVESAKACCYDEVHGWSPFSGDGLTATRYEVLLNQDYFLSLQFQHDYQGRDEPATHHLTFDLRTGRLLTVSDLVADPLDQLGRRLQAAISRRLRDELGKAVEIYGDDSTKIDDVARLYNIETWDTTPQRGLTFDTANGAAARLDEFALTSDALLLFHPVSMSRLSFEFMPDETYTFPWARIQPLSVLAPLVQASQARPKSTKRR